MENYAKDFNMDLFRLDGKVAMITGANQGLGFAYAVALAKAGADIFIPHFTDDIAEVKAAVEAEGKKVAFLQGDLTKADYRQACVDECMKIYGKIDILINNAGINFACPLIDYPDEKWAMVTDLQLDAVHYLSHAVAKVMVEQKSGKIINIASALSFSADLNATAYTVAKHGIVGMTRSYAAELGQYGITCNAVAPGFFDSEMNRSIQALRPDVYKLVSNKIPLSQGEWGKIADLMGTIVFLASPASNYVTGVVIAVDGGFKAQMI